MALLRNLVTSQRRRLTWRSARRPTTHLRCRLPIHGWTRIFSSCMSFEGLGEWASEEERREGVPRKHLHSRRTSNRRRWEILPKDRRRATASAEEPGGVEEAAVATTVAGNATSLEEEEEEEEVVGVATAMITGAAPSAAPVAGDGRNLA